VNDCILCRAINALLLCKILEIGISLSLMVMTDMPQELPIRFKKYPHVHNMNVNGLVDTP
jgi:hypothetical protein